MYRVCLVILTFVFICNYSPIIGQDTSNYFRSEEYLNKVKKLETEISGIKARKTDDDIKVNIVYPDSTLPEWLFILPASSTDRFLVLGISDPGLDSLKGLENALVRAKAIASMYINSYIGFLVENYSLEYKADNSLSDIYGQYFRTISAGNNFDKFNILNRHTTKFEETIILVEFSKPAVSADSIVFVTDALIMEKIINRKIDIRYKLSTSLIFTPPSGYNDLVSYSITGINNNQSAESVFNDTIIELPDTRLKYKANADYQINTTTISKKRYFKADLQYGLWNAYLQSILRSIYNKTFWNSVTRHGKLSDDFYTVIRQLKKETAENNFSIVIRGLQISENHLLVDLDVN